MKNTRDYTLRNTSIHRNVVQSHSPGDKSNCRVQRLAMIFTSPLVFFLEFLSSGFLVSIEVVVDSMPSIDSSILTYPLVPATIPFFYREASAAARSILNRVTVVSSWQVPGGFRPAAASFSLTSRRHRHRTFLQVDGPIVHESIDATCEATLLCGERRSTGKRKTLMRPDISWFG